MERAFEGISAGNSVVSADGEKLGTIAALRGSYLLVEKGLFFVDDYHVPMSAIDRYDEDEEEVHLNVTKDEALASGWEQEPDDPLLDLTGSRTILTGAAETPNPGLIIETEAEDD
jgi:hypothetical protein